MSSVMMTRSSVLAPDPRGSWNETPAKVDGGYFRIASLSKPVSIISNRPVLFSLQLTSHVPFLLFFSSSIHHSDDPQAIKPE